MPFQRRNPRVRRWLRNRPILPIRPSPVVDVRDPVHRDPYEPIYTIDDYYGAANRSASIETLTPTDANRFNEARAIAPIQFKNFNRTIDLQPGQQLWFDLYDYTDVKPPVRFYLTKRPYWVEQQGNIVHGTVPLTIRTADVVDIRVLVETPNEQSEIEFKINIIPTSVIDDRLTRVVDDMGRGLVIGDTQRTQALTATFIGIPTDPILWTLDYSFNIQFNQNVAGFGDVTDILMLSNDGSHTYRAKEVVGSGQKYRATFRIPANVNDAYFLRIPANVATIDGRPEPQHAIDSIPFNINTAQGMVANPVPSEIREEKAVDLPPLAPVPVQSALKDASSTTQQFPIRINVDDYLSAPLQQEQRINVVSMREFGKSVNLKPWSQTNAFAKVVDGSTIIEYTPTIGTFINNVFIANFHVEDRNHPEPAVNKINDQAFRNEVVDDVYGGGGIDVRRDDAIDPNEDAPLANLVELDNETLAIRDEQTGKIVITIRDDTVIGDPAYWKGFWEHQGNSPTCLMTAALAAINGYRSERGLSAISREEMIAAVTTDISVDGVNPLYQPRVVDVNLVEPNRPDMIDNPAVVNYLLQTPDFNFSVEFTMILSEGTANETIAFLNQISLGLASVDADYRHSSANDAFRSYLQDLIKYRLSPDYDGMRNQTVDDVEWNPAGSASWYSYKAILDHYDVPSHFGSGKDFTDMIRELQAGNAVLVNADAGELWNNELLGAAQNRADLLAELNTGADLDSRLVHAFWLTGIVTDTNGVTYIVVNDSGPGEHHPGGSGAGALYPLDQFLSAWEDTDYGYIATGDALPPLSESDATLRQFIEGAVADIPDDTTRNIIQNALGHGSFTKEIQRWKDIIDINIPGTAQIIDAFVASNKNTREGIWAAAGLSEEEVQAKIAELNVEQPFTTIEMEMERLRLLGLLDVGDNDDND